MNPGDVIELSNQLMDALMEEWDIGLWERPGPLPGHLPGQLRAAAEIEPAIREVLSAASTEAVEELERWWQAMDYYQPLVAQEYGGCRDELKELLGQECRDAQKRLVAKEEVFQTWGLAVRLLEASKEQRFENPHLATDLAEVATFISQVLDPDRYGPRWVADLEARCWAHVGNGRRLLGEMRAAADAFKAAKDLLLVGTGRGLPRARVESLEASWLTELGEMARAEVLLLGVTIFYQQAGLEHDEGRSRLQLSKVIYERGDAQRASEILREALGKIDSVRESHLAFIAQKNLAAYLLELGQADEAEAVMSSLEAPNSIILLLHGAWLRAQIQEAQGRFDEAEEALIQVRRIYLKRELGYDAALVALDLAAVYLQQGETAKVKTLAQEIYPLFMAQGIEREAFAALLVFRRAAEKEAVTLGLVRELSKVMKRIRQ